jgi:hypothetical protein
MKKYIFLVAAISLLAAACGKPQAVNTTPVAPASTPASAPAQTRPTPAQNQDISYKGQTGKTALELLEAKYPTKTKSTSYGDMVIAINNIAPDAKHFWAFYINGQFANVGAGSYQTKNGDTLSWKLEEIK